MKNKFSYTLEGVIHTRSSNRVYTHVVIGRKDIARLRREYSQPNSIDRSNAEYYKGLIEGIGSNKTCQQIALDAGWTTDVQASIWRQVRERCEQLEQSIAAGLGKLTVLQWSMSLRNAQKGVQLYSGEKFKCIDVEVRAL